ncbi:MAG: hypothetical protein QOH58_1771 [Thermoleophilaceae bacterium]|nr:hypothetical protein [Thermoleophilaceae bacterium]
MKTVFISSIQRDFGDVREAARKAVESLGMHALMAETVGASAESPRRALLERVRDADIFLLLLGPHYGEPGETGRSPTEDEYDEAVRLDKPILVLKQNIETDPEQEAFLGRTRGLWDAGKLSGSFDDAAEAGLEVVKALRGYEARETATVDPGLAARAQERAQALARGDERPNTTGSGSKARFVAAPLVANPLLDALALEDARLAEDIQNAARASGLVSNAMGLSVQVSSEGIRFEGKEENAWETLRFFVGADGAIVAEGAVGGSDRHFASSVVAAARLAELVESGQRFALMVWERIDPGHDIREAALALAVPDASHKLYAEAPLGGSMSVPMGLPHVVVAPEPPRLIKREGLGNEATTRTLTAELKRRFADEGAVHSG